MAISHRSLQERKTRRTMKAKKALLEAVEKLHDGSGHSIMTEKWGQEIASAFGIKAPVHKFKPQKTDPKGVMPNWNEELNDGKGDWDWSPFAGVYALSLASNIARKLELNDASFFGRGSQYRAHLENIGRYVDGLKA
jgi:hypothetical protein